MSCHVSAYDPSLFCRLLACPRAVLCGRRHGIKWKHDGEGDTFSWLTGHPYPTAVSLHQTLHARQPNTRARDRLFDIAAAIEWLEDMRQIGGGNAYSLVTHLQVRPLAPA